MCVATRAVASAVAGQAARLVLTDAGCDKRFIHHTGHGIGTTAHKPPHMIEGDTQATAVHRTFFSFQPGVYLAGSFRVRVEDIVTVNETGGRRLDNTGASSRLSTRTTVTRSR